MTPEKYAKTESERMEGAKTAQSKTVYKANEPRGYPSGKCQREAANEVSTRETNESVIGKLAELKKETKEHPRTPVVPKKHRETELE